MENAYILILSNMSVSKMYCDAKVILQIFHMNHDVILRNAINSNGREFFQKMFQNNLDMMYPYQDCYFWSFRHSQLLEIWSCHVAILNFIG